VENRLENGDYVLSPGGVLETVDKEEAQLQGAARRLLIQRGSFVYAPDFGCRTFSAEQAAAPGAEQKAVLLVQEALAPLAGKVLLQRVHLEETGTSVQLRAGSIEKTVLVPYA